MSAASKPIHTPDEMAGKKIGVQATNEAVWNAFLKANKIDASSIHKVPVQFDPTPLTTGEVDGWFSFVTNEPNDLKFNKNFDTVTFLLADYGYPLVSETYVVRKESLTKDREKLKALLVADIKGWHENLKDPALGAHLAVTKYGKDQHLTEGEQLLESKGQNELILTADTKANGVFSIKPELIDENIATLALAGTKITKEELFDMSVLDEVYSEHPELKKSPV